MKVLLIDGHCLISMMTQELMSVIIPEASFDVLESHEALDEHRFSRFDLIVTELHFEGIAPADYMILIQSRFPDARVVVFSTEPAGGDLADQAREHGFRYVSKSTSVRNLTNAFFETLDRKNSVDVVPENEFRSTIQIPGRKPLTKRQVDAMELAARGYSSKEIARELEMSPYTVRVHLQEAYVRLGASTRAQAVGLYFKAKSLSEAMQGE